MTQSDELTRLAARDQDDWIIDGVRHHLVVAHHHNDGSAAQSFLMPCGQWCKCF